MSRQGILQYARYRLQKVDLLAQFKREIRLYWYAPFISALAYLPYEWQRQVVTGRSVMELYYPHLAEPDSPGSWAKDLNDFIKMKPPYFVELIRWFGEKAEWESDQEA